MNTKQQLQLRGVNLGGWLVLERWMTPSLFEGTNAEDEYAFMASPHAHGKLEEHRKTFIREDDYKWLAAHHVNAVRLPVGYWVLEGDDPYVGAVDYLDWAMKMAQQYRIHTIIDVHGLPGSQNGMDHSGQKGGAQWLRHRSLRRKTLDHLEGIARRYRDNPYLWGIQITNEPKFGLIQFKLRSYYQAAYALLAGILRPDTHIIFSDGFTPRLLSGAIQPKHQPVAMDVHLYHMTTPLSQFRSPGWYLRKVVRRKKLLQKLQRDQPIIIGEWSAVLRGETMQRLPKDRQEQLTDQHIAAQLTAYRDVAGWFYWSYKTEAPGPWNFRSMIEAGRIRL